MDVAAAPGRSNARTLLLTLAVFAVFCAIYLYSAQFLDRINTPGASYFDQLADSFSKGRLDINPQGVHDLTQHNGKWYVPFPPLPALLLMPWVAISGVDGVITTVFIAIMGAFGAAFAFASARSLAAVGWANVTTADQLWLTVLFGLGSVNWYLSTIGAVWFLSQVCTATFMALALWLAIGFRSAAASGIALAVAMLARPHVALMFPLLLAIGLQHIRDSGVKLTWRDALRWTLISAVPMALSAIALLLYNKARFDSYRDFGYLTQNVAEELKRDLAVFGQFNLHYVPHNLWVMLFAGPLWDAKSWRMTPSVDGMSLVLTMPVLAFLIEARKPRLIALGGWAALALLLAPLVTYYNTGWWHFGYRFVLDLAAPLIVMLALASKHATRWRMRALIVIGIGMHAWGTWWFLNPAY